MSVFFLLLSLSALATFSGYSLFPHVSLLSSGYNCIENSNPSFPCVLHLLCKAELSTSMDGPIGEETKFGEEDRAWME